MVCRFFHYALMLWCIPLLITSCSQPPAYEASSDTRNIEIGKDINDITDFETDPEDMKMASFLSSEIAAGNLSFDLEEQSFSQNIQMDANFQAHSQSFTQVVRQQVNDSFTQGDTGQSKTEMFTQDEPDRKLDILVVVDNSGSMSQEQTNLSTKLDPLLSYVSDADWKVSVVTTDPSQPCQVPSGLIVKGDVNANTKFANAVTAGTSGSGNERGVLRSVQGLQACTGVSPWVRPTSNIAILIVSDEDNCSNGSACGADAWGQPSYLTDYLSSIRVPGVNARVYGLFHIPGETCSTAYNVGNQYNSLVSTTNGSAGSICSSDYTNTLAQISSDISATLNNTFTLSNTPQSGTLKVYVDNVLRVGGYNLTGNVVEFTSNVPQAGSQIKFVYDYTSSAVTDEFSLSQTPALETLEVYLNNVKQQPADYSYSSGSNSVIFNSTPSYNSSIIATYRKSTPALIKDFGVMANAYNVSVKVNGSPLAQSQFSYSSGSGVVSMVVAPIDGATVLVEYDEFISKKLAYSVALADWVLADMSVKDSGGADVPYSYNNNTITFPESEWVDGRSINIVSNDINPSFNTIALQANVIGDTVAISYDGSVCDTNGSLIINGSNEADISGCGFMFDDLSLPLDIDYTYVANQLQSFNLDASMLNTNFPIVVWEVKLNGVIASDYSIDAGVLSFDLPLAYLDEVMVTAYYFSDF